LEDPRFSTLEQRQRNAGALVKVLEDWMSTRDKREVMETFAGAGVPCGAVFDTKEVLEHPHLRERGMIAEIEHPVRGRFPMIGCPVRLSDSPVELKPAPLYGEHSEEVFTTLGGVTREELGELRKNRVVL
ncbi:MAG: CoA transferase, partial [Chloroflexi bacterium]|nr:CoA transferase [Chloroflexota bacterium]